ncbi:MAG: YncE family protein [Planctomycetes bacterium]|nr:YncE family protein [Planctomycetota bacterium]
MTAVSALALSTLSSALTTHVIDSIGDVGDMPKIRQGSDGLPVIAYSQVIPITGIRYLKIAKCHDADCATPATTTVLTTPGTVLEYDLAIGANGRPVVLYRDTSGLTVVTCGDLACSSTNTSKKLTTPEMNTAWSISGGRIAVGPDGNPVIAYASDPTCTFCTHYRYNATVTSCGDSICASSTYKHVPSWSTSSDIDPEISIGADGRPVLALFDGASGSLSIAKCGDARCESVSTAIPIEAGPGLVDRHSLALQADGSAVVAYGYSSNLPYAPARETRIVRCGAGDCEDGYTMNVLAHGSVPLQIVSGNDGLPIVLLRSYDGGSGKVAKCGDLGCGSASTTTALGIPLTSASMVVPGDGKPLVAFNETAGIDLAVAKCDAAACQGPDAVSSPGQSGEPLAVITSIDGATVSLVDITIGEVVGSLPVGSGPEGVAITPDGKRAFVSNVDDDSISYIDLARRVVDRVVSVGPGDVAAPRGIAVSPDGARLYVARSGQGAVAVVDVASGAVVKQIAVGGGPFGMALAPNGSKLVIANQTGGTASVIDTTTLAVVATLDVGSQPFGVATSIDGKTAYVASFGTNRVAVIDLATNSLKPPIQVGLGPFGVAPSPDGKTLYVSDNANQVSVVDLQVGATVASITVGLHPQGLAVTLDGRYLYVANQYDDTVSIVDTSARAVAKTLTVSDGPVSLGNFIAGPVFVTKQAVEYFHQGMGHYFVTADADEIAGLDQGVFAGWTRTGERWNVWSQGGGLRDVCRFFTVTFAPKGSHFYTANPVECEGVKHNRDWQFEKIAFKVYEPRFGACQIGVPLYRAFNNGMTGAPNHRYTTSTAIRNQLIQQGFADEGVAGCVPQ